MLSANFNPGTLRIWHVVARVARVELLPVISLFLCAVRFGNQTALSL